MTDTRFEARQVYKKIEGIRANYHLHETINRIRGRDNPNPYKEELDALIERYVRLTAEGEPERLTGVSGTIYVIGYGPYVKIGWTKGELEGRLKGLRTGAPEPLVVYGTIQGTMAEERELHARFADYRLQGEWFRKRGRFSAWIRGGCKL